MRRPPATDQTPPRPEPIEVFARRVLEARRHDLVERRSQQRTEADRLLAEPEPDWTDRASDVSAAAALDRLTEEELVQLAQIDAAIARLDQGIYGICVTCDRPIRDERLRAVPEAARCAGCSQH